MNVLVIGIGMQGRAAVCDLLHQPPTHRVVAADLDAAAVRERLTGLAGSDVEIATLDAADPAAVRALVRATGVDTVLFLAAPPLQSTVARACLDEGVHFVSTNYTRDLVELHDRAQQAGVALLPEMGLDPGIDLVLGRLAVDALDEVQGLDSYGGGLPVAEAADNPLRYKVTWTFEGVLSAYRRPARILQDGHPLDIPGGQVFAPDHVHLEDVPGVGSLEAYPNGDALSYREIYGLGPSLQAMGRYTLRWPGHCAFWHTVSGLGLLDDTPTPVDGVDVVPLRFLARHLEPRLRFQPGEQDLVILRVRAWGTRNGQPAGITWNLVDRGMPEGGLSAMSRTVGFTAAIGARMLHDGRIPARGVLHPVRDVPPHALLSELAARGVRCSWSTSSPGPESRPAPDPGGAPAP